MMSDDQVAAYLEDVRARNSAFGEGAADVPRLLATVWRCLELADHWDAARSAGPLDRQFAARRLRESITEELLRKGER